AEHLSGDVARVRHQCTLGARAARGLPGQSAHELGVLREAAVHRHRVVGTAAPQERACRGRRHGRARRERARSTAGARLAAALDRDNFRRPPARLYAPHLARQRGPLMDALIDWIYSTRLSSFVTGYAWVWPILESL